MTTLKSFTAVGAVSFLAGLALGALFLAREKPASYSFAKRALAQHAAVQSTIFLKAADLVHSGDTNEALGVLVGQVNFGLVDLANTLDEAEFGETAKSAMNLCLEYRRTNLWMEQYEPDGSMITTRMRALLEKSRSQEQR